MLINGPLPQESESQKIGHLAEQCFSANRPTTWRPQNLGGTDDFGYDYQVQTVLDGSVKDIFRVQLKGSLSPAPNATEEYFSLQLKASTIRYYARATEPILLILCNLGVNPESPKQCLNYFCWVHDEIRRLNENGIPPDQDFVTFRVPTTNLLTEQTDLTQDLERFRKIASVGDMLDLVAENKNPSLTPEDRASLIGKIPENIAARSPSFLQVMTESPDTAWPEAPRGSFAWYLNEAFQQLRFGSTKDASVSLDNANSQKDSATNLELAEYWYLRGKLKALNSDNLGACDAYLEATKCSNDLPKYLVAWAESQLCLRHKLTKRNNFGDIKNRLTGTDASSLGMRARLLAAEGNYDEALKLAQSIPGQEGWTAQAIIYTMCSESQRVIDTCNAGLTAHTHLKDGIKQLLFLLRARAKFLLALGSVSFDAPQTYIPATGPAGVNIELLRESWLDIVETSNLMCHAGWPPNIEFFVDIWTGAASMLGRQRYILPDLTAAANARPALPILQLALESIASQCEDWPLALEANQRQPEDETTLLRRAVLFSLANKNLECVTLLTEHISGLNPMHPMFGFALIQGILSAERIVRPDLTREWRAILDSDPALATERAIFEYLHEKADNILGIDAVLSKLEEEYNTLGQPTNIATHLFFGMDATRAEHAEKCIVLAQKIGCHRMLHADEEQHLAQALMTLARWQELLDLTQKALQRFENDERFQAIGALALDKLGRSAEALNFLKNLVEQDRGGHLAINTYINIVVRCGFTDEAIKSVETLLSRAKDPSAQTEYLRLLFSLIHTSDPGNQRSVDIAWKIGQLTCQEIEEQEGLFLITMFAATMHADIMLDESQKAEFQLRLSAFTQRFPDSKILKSISTPVDASPDEFMRMLRQVIGNYEERERWRLKIENQLQRGELPIPYAWRPRHILGSVPDLPTLWEIGKTSKPENRAYHLVMVPSDWKAIDKNEFQHGIPLLDLITLLVIYDLGLFDLIFEVFPQIAISQTTLMELQGLIAPLSGSPFRQKCIQLISMLKAHFSQIIQPVVPYCDETSVKPIHWPSEEIRQLVSTGKYTLYSDDALFRTYCDMSTEDSFTMCTFCTLDVLFALDSFGILTASEVAEKIATLCSWHVSVVIPVRYQIAILPDELENAQSVGNGIDILRESTLCAAMFDGIWNVRKPYSEIESHAAALLRELVSDPNNKVTSIAALIGFWYGKARLRTDSSLHPVIKRPLLVMERAAVINNDLTERESRNIWQIYKAIVEVEYGNRMDTEKERHSIELAGEISAEIDLRNSLSGRQSLFHLLGQGLTSGTSDSDIFSNAYTKFRITQATK